MKSFGIVCLVLTAAVFSSAEDDGKYHPERYGGDDGSYHHDGANSGQYYGSRFNEYIGRGKYDSIYAAYQPIQPVIVGAYSPYQQLLPPVSTVAPVVVNQGFDYTPLASSLSAVRYRPEAVKPITYTRPSYRYNDQNARILRQDNEIDNDAYHFAYQTENGIAVEENGRVDAQAGYGGTRVSGFFEYVGDDGKTYRVDYIADENGFQPRGAHLPK